MSSNNTGLKIRRNQRKATETSQLRRGRARLILCGFVALFGRPPGLFAPLALFRRVSPANSSGTSPNRFGGNEIYPSIHPLPPGARFPINPRMALVAIPGRNTVNDVWCVRRKGIYFNGRRKIPLLLSPPRPPIPPLLFRPSVESRKIYHRTQKMCVRVRKLLCFALIATNIFNIYTHNLAGCLKLI